jgi:hypothetical protein
MATLSSIITPSNITTATNTQTLTNKTLTGAAMNGTVGATTPSTVAATTLSANTTNDVYGLKVNAADSRLRILGHLSGFGGALIDAVNTAESAHVPLLITSNNLTIRDEATDVASFSSTGLAVTGTLSATGTINAAQNVLIGSAAPAADTTTLLTFQGSNLQRNWRLGVNVAAGEVTLTPSTANGGTTYTRPRRHRRVERDGWHLSHRHYWCAHDGEQQHKRYDERSEGSREALHERRGGFPSLLSVFLGHS